MDLEPKCPKTHLVAPGETLSQILQRYYGPNAIDKWIVVYEANKDLFHKYPNKLHPGSELILPGIDQKSE